MGTPKTCIFAVLLFTISARADSPEGGRGFTFYERFQGSANDAGLVTRLDTAAGYSFNKYVGVDAGIPIYFVRPSATSSVLGTASRNGIGNVYADVRLTVLNPSLNFASVLTGAAPTGDEASGFSTGRPTFDWTNHFDRSFSRLTPFANIGIANSISDTPFFIRPFTSLGFVGHLEGGADLKLARTFLVGASLYDVAPSGQQRIFSRVGHQSAAATQKGRPPLETSGEALVATSVAGDHGFSTWFGVRPASYFDFEAGYSRSVPYAFDTFFFGVGFNVGSLARKAIRR